MPKISIIVPVYKVEQYLDKCVRSILTQTFTDFELILVDDGSPDRCGEMCDEYAKTDSRIKVIHQKNGGLSAARNSGIDTASGEYIGFVDSDDYIDVGMYEHLYHAITKYDADVACCGIHDVYPNKSSPLYEPMPETCLDAENTMRLILEGKYISYIVCAKLFNAYMIKDLRYKTGKLYEDILFTVDYIPRVKKAVIANKPLYYYMHRGEGSITGSKVTERDYDLLEAYDKNIALCKKLWPQLTPQCDFRYYWCRFVLLDRIMSGENEPKKHFMYKELVTTLKKNTFKILKLPFFHKKRYIAAIILKINTNLYRTLMKKSK